MDNKYQHKNLIGQRFGRLLVISKTDKRSSDKKVIWECQCDCGKICYINTGSLTSGRTNSCGCLQRELISNQGKKKAKDLVGERFGKLTVVENTDKRKNKRIVWLCKCDCGNFVEVGAGHLLNKYTQSCGCLRKEIAPTLLSKRGYVNGTSIGNIKSNKLPTTNKSGYKGVNWLESSNKWSAQIMFRKKVYNLGAYENIEDAIKIRKEAEKEVFDKFLEWYNNPNKEKSDFTIKLNLNEMRDKLNIVKKSSRNQNTSMLIGQKFGDLTVMKESEKRASNGTIIWECRCECGNITYARTDKLKNGRKKSCGHCNKADEI